MNKDWLIKESASDWECDWESSTRFQLQYFKALSFTEKCKAVENMCKTAQYFATRAEARKKNS